VTEEHRRGRLRVMAILASSALDRRPPSSTTIVAAGVTAGIRAHLPVAARLFTRMCLVAATLGHAPDSQRIQRRSITLRGWTFTSEL
jgi:hypothetical protein